MISNSTSLTIGRDDSLPAPVRALVPAANAPIPPEVELSMKQKIAIELLIVGTSFNEVAKTIHVDRGTIWRWRSYDANFIAGLNRWRRQMIDELRDRALALGDKATRAVEKSIEGGDARIALQVMDKLGTLKPGPVDPTDPYAVFGAGLEDEVARGEVNQGFQHIRTLLTIEQASRVVELLAIGVVVDDRRKGRNTPSGVLELAGQVDGEHPVSETVVYAEPTEVPQGSIAVAIEKKSVSRDENIAPAQPPLRVKARVVSSARLSVRSR